MFRKILFASLLALGATQTVSFAQTTEPATRDCFQVREITGQEVIDDRTIKLTARNVDYLVSINANARQLNFSEPLIINTHGGQICTGNGLNVELHIGRRPAIPVMVRQIVRAPETDSQG